jgi:hypothetical protein
MSSVVKNIVLVHGAFELEKEVEHSVRIAKIVMSHLTGRYPELFPLKDVPWYAPGDEEVPK